MNATRLSSEALSHEHCWHLANPKDFRPWHEIGSSEEYCCHCGAERTAQYVAGPGPEHGRYLRLTGEEWHTVYSEPRPRA